MRSWHAELVSDDAENPKLYRPIPTIKVSRFYERIERDDDSGEYWYKCESGMNGWLGLQKLKVVSITRKSTKKFVRNRAERLWSYSPSGPSIPVVKPDSKMTYRVSLESPEFAGKGWTESSPGFVWWYRSHRNKVLHGSEALDSLRTDVNAVRAHLFAHRYSRGKKKETQKNRITWHAAVLLEWDHGKYCTVVELATLNGIGGRLGRSNWYPDKFEPKTKLFQDMPPCMIVPWKGAYAEIRVNDVASKSCDEFVAYLKQYEGEFTKENPGGTKRFLSPTVQYSHAIRLTYRSERDIMQYLLNYMGRDRRYTQEFRNCQAFAADFYAFVCGKKDIEPYHATIRLTYKRRTHLFLYNPDMYSIPGESPSKEEEEEKKEEESDTTTTDWGDYWDEEDVY
eukprot:g6105.t1